MDNDPPHADIRRISKLQVSTPLIAPSFSSRGFPYISNIWKEFEHKLYGVCLVSAFDIAQKRIPADVADNVNIVFIDSGLYETSEDHGVGKLPTARRAGEWHRSKYHETTRDIDYKGNVILVNYDEIKELDKQIESSSDDFSQAPQAVADFLIKPEALDEEVNMPKLIQHTDALREFGIIGISAREVGNSFLSRCRSVTTLRNILNDAGLDTPIHVFGAINPYEVLTYFLCGADIFDGLNWLRLAFRRHASLPVEETAMEDMKWNLTDLDLLSEEWTRNLNTLYQLQESLHTYGASGNLESLEEDFPLASQAVHVAEIAGAEIRK